MNRRQVLASGLAALTPLSGCISSTPVFGDSTRFRVRYVEILNWAESPRTVTVTIERDGRRRFDGTKTVLGIQGDELQSWRIDEPWMDDTAEYTVSLETERGGSVTTSTRDVAESFDLDSDADRCLRWTFQLRADGSIGVFPNINCPNERETTLKRNPTSNDASATTEEDTAEHASRLSRIWFQPRSRRWKPIQ